MLSETDPSALPPEAQAILKGWHYNPFHYLGPHLENSVRVVRAFLPEATEVVAISGTGAVAPLARLHPDGLFSGPLPNNHVQYRLRARFGSQVIEFEDPYRFPPFLSDFDLNLLAEGTEMRLTAKLGAHPRMIDGVEGVGFAVFAPNARRVSVVGDFNSWDGRWHAMRARGQGFWEIFVPGARAGDKYKFEIVAPDGGMLPLKSDPLAFAAELRPNTASVVMAEDSIPLPQPARSGINDRGAPISIYEMHLGSWRRRPGDDHRWLSYRELADELPAYVSGLGFTHVEFLPVSEHPFDGSWGYQPTGLFAPTSRFGTPEDFAYLVDACHKAGLGVFVDWVPAHFPDDPHGLGRFDGTALYEHADPKEGRHNDWNTLIYNFGRREVGNFLLASGLHWLEQFGIDGLRVDAVASMLYRDYSRESGGWVPNEHGGRENLEAVAFLRRFNTEAFARFPEATIVAEESTAWPMVSRPVDWGGLGFGYKWNLGWMHDTLDYISKDPVHRKYHHERMTFGLLYAFNENFILPLSHDEVVHGKHSLIGRMPGDEWQRFANLRAYYGFMFGHPGKKLLFMGCEFAQESEWRHDHSLDWHLIGDPKHAGILALVRDLNRLYRQTPALHQNDCEASGFEWVIADDADNSIFAWLRKGADPRALCLVVVNFTPEVRDDYCVSVPVGGVWREMLNTDAALYGGTNTGNAGHVEAIGNELRLTVPPLAALFLTPES